MKQKIVLSLVGVILLGIIGYVGFIKYQENSICDRLWNSVRPMVKNPVGARHECALGTTEKELGKIYLLQLISKNGFGVEGLNTFVCGDKSCTFAIENQYIDDLKGKSFADLYLMSQTKE